MEPYQGGKHHNLWALTELDNTDKHRVLLDVTATVASTQQATKGRFVTHSQLNPAEHDQSLGFGITTDQPLSHPFIKTPPIADLFPDARLEVEYSTDNTEPVRDGTVLHQFTRAEWRDVITYSPRLQIAFGEGPLHTTPLLHAIHAITADVESTVTHLRNGTL